MAQAPGSRKHKPAQRHREGHEHSAMARSPGGSGSLTIMTTIAVVMQGYEVLRECQETYDVRCFISFTVLCTDSLIACSVEYSTAFLSYTACARGLIGRPGRATLRHRQV